ncbi:MAG TPA: hypothetical protein VGE37_04515, partial [Archangium sp.]
KGTELFLDRPNARHGNNAIGQQAADAFAWVFSESDRPVDFAVVNGGSIRAEGLCITRNIVREGPLSNGVLHEIMLFENPVQAVTSRKRRSCRCSSTPPSASSPRLRRSSRPRARFSRCRTRWR